METLEHLDADSETDAISDIQPVLNVTPNVRQTSVILASVRHQTHCSVEDPLTTRKVLHGVCRTIGWHDMEDYRY